MVEILVAVYSEAVELDVYVDDSSTLVELSDNVEVGAKNGRVS